MELEDFDHGFVLVEHVDKFLTHVLLTLVLHEVASLVTDNSIISSHCRDFDKVFRYGECVVEDFVHVLHGAELEGLAEHDWSRLLGLVDRC